MGAGPCRHRAAGTTALGVTAVVVGLLAFTTPVRAAVRLPVVRSVVALPARVKGVVPETCTWTRDGSALLCGFDVGSRGEQVGTIRPAGGGFRCVSCGAGLVGHPWRLYAFADGRRFFVGTLPRGSANASAGANIIPQIGECTPSLLDCRHATIGRVALPTIPGDLNNREPRISPDGQHYLWTVVRIDGFLILMGDLSATPTGYRVATVRVLNAVPDPHSAAAWADRGSFSEAKSFDGGERLVFASSRGGFNWDDYELELSTGSVRRITHELEWDEDAQFDPTDRYLIVSSARHMHNQLRSTALADYPSFVDGAWTVFVSTAMLGTTAVRLHTLELWLTTAAEERAGGSGEMLNDKSGGWSGQASSSPWSPEGTRAAWVERNVDGRTRIVVVSFPELRRRPPACANPDTQRACQTPTPTWAPLISDYPSLERGVYSIPGPRGGSATLHFRGAVVGENRVRLSRFTDQEGRTFEGTIEVSAALQRGGLSGTAREDIAISGRHSGHTSALIGARHFLVCGTADTVLDGRHLHTNVGEWNPSCAFATPRRCPDGADADATDTGTCSHDGLPSRWLAPTLRLSLTAQATRLRPARPLRFLVFGRLRAQNANISALCALPSIVSVQVKSATNTISVAQVHLRRDCVYSLRITLRNRPHTARLRFLARYRNSYYDLVIAARTVVAVEATRIRRRRLPAVRGGDRLRAHQGAS